MSYEVCRSVSGYCCLSSSLRRSYIDGHLASCVVGSAFGSSADAFVSLGGFFRIEYLNEMADGEFGVGKHPSKGLMACSRCSIDIH